MESVIGYIFATSNVALKNMDKFVGLQHVLEKRSVFFITCLLNSFKDGKQIFVYDNHTKITIQLNQIKACFAIFFNSDDAIITNIMKEQNIKILMLVDLVLKRSCSILGGVMFTISSVVKGAFIYYLLTDPIQKLSNLLSTIDHDRKLVGKGLGQIILRKVYEVLFKVSSTSLLCAE